MKINDLSKILYFQEAAKSLSYTEAARKLDTTPSSVQRGVKALEDSLGVKLFIRKSKGLALTPAGKILFDRTLQSLKELELAKKEIAAQKHETPFERVRILTTLGLAADWVYKCIPLIRAQYTTLKIELLTSNLELSLEAEEYDVYIGPKTESALNYKSQFLFNCDFKLYASKQYIEQYGCPKTMQDLRNHKHIKFSNLSQVYFSKTNKIYADIDDYEDYDLIVDFYLVEQLLTRENMGIAMIAQDVVDVLYPEFVDIFPHKKPVSIAIYFYCLAKNLNERFIQELFNWLMQTLPYK